MKVILVLLGIMIYVIIGYTIVKILVKAKIMKLSQYSNELEVTFGSLGFPLLLMFYMIRFSADWLFNKVDQFTELRWLKRIKKAPKGLTEPEQWVGWLEKRITLNDHEQDYILYALREISKNKK